jgi:uncharacterized protein YyaL (SSP411 family)
MDRESYSRPELAALVNANSVTVKVDYDTQAQLAVQLERAQAVLNLPSRLPLTGFLTPSGKLSSVERIFRVRPKLTSLPLKTP